LQSVPFAIPMVWIWKPCLPLYPIGRI